MRFLLATGLILACLMTAGMLAPTVRAGTVTVDVGYADDLRPNAYFPNPWRGSPNTTFLGGTSFDSGAVLIINNTGFTINVNSLVVSGFDNGATFNLWGTPGALANGHYMILTGYNSTDFDTSDQLGGFSYPDTNSGFTPTHPYTGDPTLALTIDGTLHNYADTGHILDTGGYDTATFPLSSFPNNESLQWRPVGTTGIDNPGGSPPNAVPEPSMLGLGLIGSLGALVYARRRRRLMAV